MKGTIRNIFEKPIVLLMLILICLTPISPINQACNNPDPPDCNAELAAIYTAKAGLNTAKAALAAAETELNDATKALPELINKVTETYTAYKNACLQVAAKELNVSAAEAYLAAAGVALIYALETKIPLLIISATALCYAAKRNLEARKKELSVAKIILADCETAYFNAEDKLAAGRKRISDAITAYIGAIECVNASIADVAGAYDAYIYCLSGQ